jgi:DNA-binding MarR family transcriptional regulator
VSGRKKPVTTTSARAQILKELAVVGREHSDATVIFHAAVASLLDLHPTDYKALGLVERLGPLSAGDLAKHSGLATASVTSLLDRLEARGFVRRVRDGEDRRRVLVEPVRERLTAGRALFASPVRSLGQLYEGYSDTELAVIADFLARNAARLRDETAALHETAREVSNEQPAPEERRGSSTAAPPRASTKKAPTRSRR